MTPDPAQKFVGIQLSPISFVDEGVEAVLDTLQTRVGVNVLMLGTVSWLGLKSGRSISHALDGWPDHGVPEPYRMKGGAYFDPDPRYYRDTFMADYRSRDPEFEGKDILKMVIPAAHARGMKVYVELMEPFFKYAGHGSAASVEIPTLAQAMEVDILGRLGGEPSTSNPGYRGWIHSMIEDQVRNHDLDGLMWCNERNSPLDTLIQGGCPGDFSAPARREAEERGVNAEACRQALLRLYDVMQELAAGKAFVDGSLITFLRALLDNPEALVWEKVWLERNKDLDRELYGLVKWCKPQMPFGLNVWNRNHFNLIRRAQWPWEEQTRYADFVKPITYQHQAGEVWAKELSFFRKTVLRDFEPGEATTALFRILGLNEAPFAEIVGTGMDPDTYVFGQCADALRGVNGKAKVYMGVGVDAPRSTPQTAKMSEDIAYRSVMATYRAGGDGVVLAPNYASMHLTHLDGVARALSELGAPVTADLAIVGATLVTPEGERPGTLVVRDGRIAGIAALGEAVAGEAVDASGCHVLPGLIDIHCHIRAPAYPQRGTVASETAACAAGGITTVFEMPITDPCCNTPQRVALRRDHFAATAVIDFGLYAAPATLTEEAVDALAAAGIVAFKIFTTPAPPGRSHEFDGLAWPDEADQLRALTLIARTGLPVVVHAESAALLAQAEAEARGLDPADARTHGAARPPLAEALAIAKLLTLNAQARARLHIAHVTCAAAVDVLRRFAGSSDFSAETCPHYLRYTEADVARAGVAAKINPPIRQTADREALWEAVADGTIGHVTTDHAGFSEAEKAAHAGNFLTAPPGHPGTECLLPSLLDAAARGRLGLAKVADLTARNAAARFGLPDRGRLEAGARADLVMVDLAAPTRVTRDSLLTAAAPVAALSLGETFQGRVVHTWLAGRTVWDGTQAGPVGAGQSVAPEPPR